MKCSYVPMILHLGLVLIAGIYLPRRSSPGSRPWRSCSDRRGNDTTHNIARTGRKAASHRPWPRAVVDGDGWKRAIQELVEARATLLGCGATRTRALALLEERSDAIAVFTLECPDGKFPSVGAHHPAAIRLERTITDLYGLKPTGAADARHCSISASGA